MPKAKQREHVTVAGTGHEGRADRIARHCRVGSHVILRREPNNAADENAIAMYLAKPGLFGLGTRTVAKIGYVPAWYAKHLAPQMDRGLKVRGRVEEYDADNDTDWPNVKVALVYDRPWAP